MKLYPILSEDDRAASLAAGELVGGGAAVHHSFGWAAAVAVTVDAGRADAAMPRIVLDDDAVEHFRERWPAGFDFLITRDVANRGALWPKA